MTRRSASRSARPALALAATAGLVLLALLSARLRTPSPARELIELAGSTMGTTWSARLAVPPRFPRTRLDAARDSVQAALARVDATMSTWDTTSELSRLDRARTTDPIPVSPGLMRVLETAAKVSRMSGGAFDVTVAPLVDAWGFGPGPRHGEPPPDSTLAALRRHVGWKLLELDREAGTVRKLDPQLSVDLSAIAKGYGVDRAVDALDALGFHDFAVEVGGEVRAVGSRPGGAPWRIGLQTPSPGSSTLMDAIPLRNRALATSGDYRNFFEIDGVRYAHILDPRTGRPVHNRGASVTVLAGETMWADAWATALSVLGPREGAEVAGREGIAALFVVREDDGFRELKTPAFRAAVDTVEVPGAREGEG